MKFFLDTEFLPTGPHPRLVSIGLVSHAGAEFYAVSDQVSHAELEADEWMAQHVLPSLVVDGAPAPMPPAQIVKGLLGYFEENADGRVPQLWAFNAVTDFSLFDELFGGRRVVKPLEHVPHRYFDVKQWAHHLGNPTLPAQADGQHNALADAHHCRAQFAFLAAYERDQQQRRERRVRDKMRAEVETFMRTLTAPAPQP